MKTLLLDPIRDNGALRQAGALLRAGEVVGMPTETVYGLAANALDSAAVAKIFLAKGRPQDNPLIVHIADKEQLSTLARMVPESARKLADAFWPGPLTIILPKAACIPDEVSAGLDTVGIRLPSHPVARALIREAGVPLAAPSANLSGRPSTTTSGHVMDDLGGRIPAIVEGGPCAVGVESTVVSLAGDVPRLLRPGGVSLEQLESVLGSVEVDRALREKIGDEVRVSAPGMKYRHYAPKAPVTVVCGDPERTAVYITRHAGLDAALRTMCRPRRAVFLTRCGRLMRRMSQKSGRSARTIPASALRWPTGSKKPRGLKSSTSSDGGSL